MERVRLTEHRGTPILWVDFSGIQEAEELRRGVEEAKQVIRQQPPRSARVLVDLRDIPYSLERVNILREAVIENRPYVRARAVVGLPAVAHLSFRAVAHVAGRPMQSFSDVEQAKDWLVEQE